MNRKRNQQPTKAQELSHIKDLVSDPQNRRVHNPRNLGMVSDALREVGAARSIVIDENNVILAGNGVTEAAAEAGITRLRVIEADGNELIAVRRRGLTEEQKRNLAIYDNRTAELANWNAAQFKDDLGKGLGFEKFFSQDELQAILGTEEAAEGLTDPDEVPAERATGIVAGDLFELGRHRLLCGDSTNADDVARVMDDATPALLLTDPPYGIGFKYASHDDSSNADNKALVRSAFRVWGCESRVWTPGKMNLARELADFPDAKVLCWHKKFSGAGNGLGGASTWEPVLAVGVHGGRLANDYLEFMTDREPGLNDRHPCPKPVALFVLLADSLAPPKACIAEPFSGSGTTLIACEQAQRSVRAMEIEPQYVQVAIDRWEAFTGQKAVKVGEAVLS